MAYRSALLRACALLTASSALAQTTGTSWPVYGGNAGGPRYSSADEITAANISHLHVTWELHTGALATSRPSRTEAAFEATPILHGRTLFLSTPFDQVMATDAVSGQLKWRYDPQVPADFVAGVFTSRGVAFWGKDSDVARCGQRIFIATLDGRLLALDAQAGTPCADFGSAGTVDLKKNLPTQTNEPYQEYGVTSPPTVVGNVVIVGSAVADGQEVDGEPGVLMVTRGGLVFAAATREPVLRAFDEATGALVWSGKLPVPAQSTPMTYELDGKQYVVIAAGGHGGFGTPQGDSLIAFSLQ